MGLREWWREATKEKEPEPLTKWERDYVAGMYLGRTGVFLRLDRDTDAFVRGLRAGMVRREGV
jgi:hypothetical protein